MHGIYGVHRRYGDGDGADGANDGDAVEQVNDLNDVTMVEVKDSI